MSRGAEAGRFLRFCAVGGAGFLADAGVLLLLTQNGVGPVGARAVSVSAAILLTFAVNRAWTFRGRTGGIFRDLAAYLAVQGAGFLCNVAVYVLAVAALPAPWSQPLPALALASAAALSLNYLGVSRMVFGR